ncbi:hypothetical protein [Aquabacterium sp.]|uniref:hypothetical protein n=1 Tax=Aquabacterium sp. TaxID=1872578 RepID=UPI004037EEED
MNRFESLNTTGKVALVTAALLASSTCWAEPTTADKLALMARLEVMLEHTRDVEDIYLRNCQSVNPEIGQLMQAHRQPVTLALNRVHKLSSKYSTRLANEWGQERAAATSQAIQAGQAQWRKSFQAANSKDEAEHNFDCLKDPSTLANVPPDMDAILSQLEAD